MKLKSIIVLLAVAGMMASCGEDPERSEKGSRPLLVSITDESPNTGTTVTEVSYNDQTYVAGGYETVFNEKGQLIHEDNLLKREWTSNYRYDENGNMIYFEQFYKGMLTTEQELTYDSENRITAEINMPSMGVLSKTEYFYQDGRLIRKEYSERASQSMLTGLMVTRVSNYSYSEDGRRCDKRVNDFQHNVILYDAQGRMVKDSLFYIETNYETMEEVVWFQREKTYAYDADGYVTYAKITTLAEDATMEYYFTYDDEHNMLEQRRITQSNGERIEHKTTAKWNYKKRVAADGNVYLTTELKMLYEKP